MAGVGPPARVALLLALGVLSLLTMACMAEAIARSDAVRYSNAFYGRLVADSLRGAGGVGEATASA